MASTEEMIYHKQTKITV